MKERTEDLLMEIGIMPHLVGFDYITKAIEIINTDKIKPQMQDIYNKLAEEYGITWHCVERGIRHAITKMDLGFWAKLSNNAPKNAEVIFALALIIKRGEQ